MSAMRCPRCKQVTDFAAGAKKICPHCNFPGADVRVAEVEAAVEEAQLVAPARPSFHANGEENPLQTAADNPWAVLGEGPKPVGRSAPSHVAHVPEPGGTSWTAEALKPPPPPKPRHVPAHESISASLVDRIRRRFGLYENVVILDCLDVDMMQRGIFGGRTTLVLTEDRVHHVQKRLARSKGRITFDVRAVSGAGYDQRWNWMTILTMFSAGTVLGAVAAAALAVNTGALQAVALGAGGALVVLFTALGIALGREREVWVLSEGGQRVQISLRRVKEERLQSFVDRVLAQKDLRAG
jgi:hypothetical protein